MRGRILRTDGTPIVGALIDVWQADDHGLYDVQYDDLDAPRGRGRLRSEEDGRFWFWSVLPVAYPIPATARPASCCGPADATRCARRTSTSASSLPGASTLTTHVFAAGDEHLASDAVFGVKTLADRAVPAHAPGPHPTGARWTCPTTRSSTT